MQSATKLPPRRPNRQTCWNNLHDIKRHFPTADYVGDDRVVFDIAGNKYRIIARVAYGPWYRLMIKFVGTHAEYDRVNARTV